MDRIVTHLHTQMSNLRMLDAIVKPQEAINYALELGLKGLCVTDHESISAAVEFNQIAKKLKETNPDFKIGIGDEHYLVDKRENGIKYYHFLTIAKNKEGFKLLKKISSIAWMNSYMDRGLERVPITKEELKNIIKLNPGNLIATSACLGGEVSSNILIMESARKVGDIQSAEIAKQNIIDFVLFMKDLFGEDFYFEVAPSASPEQIIVNKKMVELSKAFNVKMILGDDVHYLKEEDRYVHKAFLNSKSSTDRETDKFYEYSYMQSEEEVIKNLTPSIVDLTEELFTNSMEIYDKLEYYELEAKSHIPISDVNYYPKMNVGIDYPILKELFNSDNQYERAWVNEIIIELKNKKLDKKKEYWEQLETEAKVIKTIGNKLEDCLFKYFTTFKFYTDLFWDCGSVVGPGRGSATGFLSNYLLGITQLDPIKNGLAWWRFLNEDRAELPDIDTDIDSTKRPLIIQKIREQRQKYLSDNLSLQEKENLGITFVATFRKESTKSAVLTAARGYRSEEYPDGIDVDTSQYLSSLVPAERGFTWSLHDVMYGNPEKDRRPISDFAKTVEQYPRLLEIMFGIENLISGRGIHASGVIMFDGDPYDTEAFMKAPNGELITAWDLHESEYCGAVKFDYLITEAVTKIGYCLNLLKEHNKIEGKTLREIYNKYLHPEILNVDNENLWNALANGSVLDVFQFSSAIGLQAAKKIKPKNPIELTIANAMVRLMPQDGDSEAPIDKYVRFKNNFPSAWYAEMKKYNISNEEKDMIKDIYIPASGCPCTQEDMMILLMRCGFSLAEANSARKIVAKKKMSEIPKLKELFYSKVLHKDFANYIWDTAVKPGLGYSFSKNHATPYSYVGIQMLELATKWSPLYWDTSCLMVNSGSVEDAGDNKKKRTADYGKIAKAIGNMQSKGINVSLLDINNSNEFFEPDEKHNRILYGLKAISGINEDIINQIKENRPYYGIKDFMTRCPLTKTAVINLIKAGAFDEVDGDFNHNRKAIMIYYIMQVCEPKKKLNLQNFNGLIQHNLIPKELELQVRIFNFAKYIKANKKHGDYFVFDDNCLNFYTKFLSDEQDKLESINSVICIKQLTWDKIYKKKMDVAREWVKEHQEELLKAYNKQLFLEVWNKYATGSISHWEMESACLYHHEHELLKVDSNKYGIVNFFNLNQQSDIDYYHKRGGREIPIYKLSKIAGTVLAKDDNRSSITLLTKDGVVNVKFSRDQYAKFKAQLSERLPDNTKVVREKGWFKRGVLLMITGYRREDDFVCKTYAATQSHSIYKIVEVCGDQIKLQHERWTSAAAIEEEDYDY